MLDVGMIDKYGLPIAMLIILSGGFAWVMRITIKHFISTIESMSSERRENNAAFLGAIEKFGELIGEQSVVLRGVDDITKETHSNTERLLRVADGK